MGTNSLQSSINTIQQVLEDLAEQQGHITLDQIDESLADEFPDSEMLDQLLINLQEKDIAIVDSVSTKIPAESKSDSNENSTAETKKIKTTDNLKLHSSNPKQSQTHDTTNAPFNKEDEASSINQVPFSSVYTDDQPTDLIEKSEKLDDVQLSSLEIYLSEIGDFQPLPLEKELAFGERIVKGELMLKEHLFSMPYIMHKLGSLLTQMKYKKKREEAFFSLPRNTKMAGLTERLETIYTTLRKSISEYYAFIKEQCNLQESNLVELPFKKNLIHEWTREVYTSIKPVKEWMATLQKTKSRSKKNKIQQRLKRIMHIHRLETEALIHNAEVLQELDNQIIDAKNQMTQANLKLVVHIAKHQSSMEAPLYDLIQEGNIGLMWAVDRYDYKKGYRFSTYATWWIRQFMQQYILKNAKSIQIPSYVNSQINKVVRTAREMRAVLNRQPTPEELAERLEWSPKKVKLIRHIVQTPVSLDAPVGESEELSLVDYVPSSAHDDPVQVLENYRLKELLEQAIQQLPEMERNVLSLQFGFEDGHPYTVKEIAESLDISRKQVRYYHLRGLKLLRDSQSGKKLKAFLEN